MTGRTRRAERRTDALSKERIVAAAIEILDAGGEGALTFRALAARLSTGSGAIYWHVAGKAELLTAATDEVIAGVIGEDPREEDPREAIRALALGIFDAIDAHPWVGTQLSREPWTAAMVQVYEGLGGPVAALGVPEEAQFDTASALVSYVLGVAGQNAANARLALHPPDRAAFLTAVAQRWSDLDPVRYPFVHRIAGRLPGHDDREQFLAGIDLFLAGAATLR